MLEPGGGDGCVGVLVGGCVEWVGWLDGSRRGCREPGAGWRVRGGRRERGGHDVVIGVGLPFLHRQLAAGWLV